MPRHKIVADSDAGRGKLLPTEGFVGSIKIPERGKPGCLEFSLRSELDIFNFNELRNMVSVKSLL